MPGLDPERIAAALPRSRRAVARIEVLRRCASTADELRERLRAAGAEACAGLALLAEEQTAGRGRRARDWWSGPAGANLSLSLCLAPPVEPGHAAGLLAGCALAAAAEEACGRPAALKWPNDVLVDGAKIAGLLVEAPTGPVPCLLLGAGINVGAAPPDGTAPYATACLAGLAGRPVLREAVLTDFLAGLERRWAAYLADGPAALEAEFLARLRAWAPHGVRAPGDASLPSGPLVEFSVREGLTWGREGHEARCEAGLLPALEALASPGD
jgi:BirA family biotin operon repressor/biotin-[acetyl-CoA-carboxylase] ligase